MTLVPAPAFAVPILAMLETEYRELIDKTQRRPPTDAQRQRLAQLDSAILELRESDPAAT